MCGTSGPKTKTPASVFHQLAGGDGAILFRIAQVKKHPATFTQWAGGLRFNGGLLPFRAPCIEGGKIFRRQDRKAIDGRFSGQTRKLI